MSKLPSTKHPPVPAKPSSRPLQGAEPVRIGTPFFSFRYSVTQVSVEGSKTVVKSRQTRLEDGRLTQESFEGELDRNEFERLAAQAQRQIVAQAEHIWRAFTWFLPRPRGDRD